MPQDYFKNWQPDQNLAARPSSETPHLKSEPASAGVNEPNLRMRVEQKSPLIQSGTAGQDGSFIEVWKNLWGLITAPKTTIARIKNQSKIGWLYGSIALIYVIMIAIFFIWHLVVFKFIDGQFNKTGMPGFDLLSFFSVIFKNSLWTGLAGLIVLVYLLFIIISISAYWAILTLIIHLFATIFGGRKPYWVMGVFNLYLILLLAVISIILVLIMMQAMSTQMSLFFILYFILFLAVFVWLIILAIKGVKEHYELSTSRAVLIIITPLMIYLLIAGVLAGLIWYSAKKRVVPKSNYSTMNNPFLKFDNLLANNAPPLLSENSQSVNQRERFPFEKYTEASKEYRLEIDKYQNLIPSIDKMRIKDLVHLKYYLDYYYEKQGKYPKSIGQEKLDGKNDSLNKELNQFYSVFVGLKDPEAPKYYYAYSSDGANYELTCYLTGPKEIYKITNQQ